MSQFVWKVLNVAVLMNDRFWRWSALKTRVFGNVSRFHWQKNYIRVMHLRKPFISFQHDSKRLKAFSLQRKAIQEFCATQIFHDRILFRMTCAIGLDRSRQDMNKLLYLPSDVRLISICVSSHCLFPPTVDFYFQIDSAARLRSCSLLSLRLSTFPFYAALL